MLAGLIYGGYRFVTASKANKTEIDAAEQCTKVVEGLVKQVQKHDAYNLTQTEEGTHAPRERTHDFVP